MSNKLLPSAQEALADLLHDNILIASGGFGLCGIPERLLDAVRDSGVMRRRPASFGTNLRAFPCSSRETLTTREDGYDNKAGDMKERESSHHQTLPA